MRTPGARVSELSLDKQTTGVHPPPRAMSSSPQICGVNWGPGSLEGLPRSLSQGSDGRLADRGLVEEQLLGLLS